MDVVGYDDVDGDMVGDDDIDGDVVGAARRRAIRRAPLMRKPGWRKNVLAAGVQMPQDGLVPLSLVPNSNSGVFDSTHLLIDFIGKVQKPFRGERLVATVALTGNTAGQVQCTSLFVGTDLQQASVGSFDLSIFAPGAFGVRMIMKQQDPGVETVLKAAFVGSIGTGTAVTSLTILGRYIF